MIQWRIHGVYAGFALAAMMLVLAGCSHEDDPVGPRTNNPIGAEVVVDASDFDNWVFFSFAAGEAVAVDDPASSDVWDLGLQRYHVATNSGDSGPGLGGACTMGQVEFSACTEAPESGYQIDVTKTFHGMQGDYDVSVNPVLEDWASREGMPPTWSFSNDTYVVKTAAGKFVKIWFKNYYNQEGVSGHITFQYLFQPDGSRNLDE